MNAVANPAAGLLTTAAQPIPLLGVQVEAEIRGAQSRVVLRQRYRNAEAVPVEAVYVFPVPEAAALCGLTVVIGERRIEARVEEREQAFAAYDDALQAGHGAVLLDQERPNVLTLSVGNLLPGQEIAVELEWVAELGRDGDALRFALPTTVAPRYAPAEDLRGVSPTPAERLSPPVGLEGPCGFSFAASVELPGGLAAVESPSHPVRVTLDGERARVELVAAQTPMDRDLVLLLTPRQAARPLAMLERQPDGELVAALTFLPAVAGDRRLPREITFLVDRSGSMHGSSIEEVRRALQLCLRSLQEGDRFDIVGFGPSHASLFGASRPYDQQSLDEASRHVAGMQADMGGTEILPALEAVLTRPAAPGLERRVVLLTDGEVTNEPAVIALAGEHADTAAIFTFGIGFGASEHLVRAVARASRGACEMIFPGERLEAKVLRQLGRLAGPVLRDVTLAWDGLTVLEQVPHRLPRLFVSEPVTVYARLRGTRSGVARLAATGPDGPCEWVLPFEPASATDGHTLGRLCARAAIRALEDGTSPLHDGRGSQQAGRQQARVQQAILELALKAGLASSATSFVAVETREGQTGLAPAELRRVPVALTHGWGGADRVRSAPAPTMAMPFPARAPVMRASVSMGAPLAMEAFDPGAPDPGAFFQRSRRAPAAGGVDVCLAPSRSVGERAARYRETPSLHEALAARQRADGSWQLDAEIARLAGVQVAALRRLVTELSARWRPQLDHELIVATTVALHLLRTRAADHADEWRLLAEKAARWLAAACARVGLAVPAVEAAVAAAL